MPAHVSSSRDVADDHRRLARPRPRPAAPSPRPRRASTSAHATRRALARRRARRSRARCRSARRDRRTAASPARHKHAGDPARRRMPRAECTFARHDRARGRRAGVRRDGAPHRVVLGRDRRPSGPAALAHPAPALGVGRRHAHRLDRDRADADQALASRAQPVRLVQLLDRHPRHVHRRVPRGLAPRRRDAHRGVEQVRHRAGRRSATTRRSSPGGTHRRRTRSRC